MAPEGVRGVSSTFMYNDMYNDIFALKKQVILYRVHHGLIHRVARSHSRGVFHGVGVGVFNSNFVLFAYPERLSIKFLYDLSHGLVIMKTSLC